MCSCHFVVQDVDLNDFDRSKLEKIASFCFKWIAFPTKLEEKEKPSHSLQNLPLLKLTEKSNATDTTTLAATLESV